MVRNYLEKVVLEILDGREDCAHLDAGLREDLMCLTLNQLPTRYYRDEEKMERYLTDEERQEMNLSARAAVDGALDYLSYAEADNAAFSA